MNKQIKRGEASAKIFDDRSLERDYATLLPILKEGMQVLDVGCGTGAISKGIADRVGKTGSVVGIDDTEAFIESGMETYYSVLNLKLLHADLFLFEPDKTFDLIVSARVLQWLGNPAEAIEKMKTWLKPGGQLSVLDYNHTAIEWQPKPPQSMQHFYRTFLKWRADAGMDNAIADHLPALFAEAGLHSVEVYNADEVYKKGAANFKTKLAIWSKVADSTQVVEEGYLKENERLQAIEEYNAWIEQDAEQMTMKLKEVRGKI